MNKIEIEKDVLLVKYDSASKKQKQILEDVFGPEAFTRDITEIVTSFEAACKYLGKDPMDEIPFKVLCPTPTQMALNSVAEMWIITRALNERELTADEIWYNPVFDRSAGFGLTITYCVIWYSYATVGERLSFKNEKLALFAGRKFLDKYKNFMVVDKKLPR